MRVIGATYTAIRFALAATLAVGLLPVVNLQQATAQEAGMAELIEAVANDVEYQVRILSESTCAVVVIKPQNVTDTVVVPDSLAIANESGEQRSYFVEEMNIGGTQMYATLDVSNASHLKSINLFSPGEFLKEIRTGSNSSLEALNLDSGSFSLVMGGLSGLKFLSKLDGSISFSDSSSLAAACPNLQTCGLSRVAGFETLDISGFGSLKSLMFSPLEGQSIANVSQCASLEELSVSGENVTSIDGLSEIVGTNHVKKISVSNCAITDPKLLGSIAQTYGWENAYPQHTESTVIPESSTNYLLAGVEQVFESNLLWPSDYGMNFEATITSVTDNVAVKSVQGNDPYNVQAGVMFSQAGLGILKIEAIGYNDEGKSWSDYWYATVHAVANDGLQSVVCEGEPVIDLAKGCPVCGNTHYRASSTSFSYQSSNDGYLPLGRIVSMTEGFTVEASFENNDLSVLPSEGHGLEAGEYEVDLGYIPAGSSEAEKVGSVKVRVGEIERDGTGITANSEMTNPMVGDSTSTFHGFASPFTLDEYMSIVMWDSGHSDNQYVTEVVSSDSAIVNVVYNYEFKQYGCQYLSAGTAVLTAKLWNGETVERTITVEDPNGGSGGSESGPSIIPPSIPSDPEPDEEVTVNDDGSTSTIVTEEDGSKVVETVAADGSVSTVVKKDPNGKVTAMEAVVAEDVDSKTTVVLPMDPVAASTPSSNEGVSISVKAPVGTKVSVPVVKKEGSNSVAAGCVLVIVDADGKEAVLPKTSVSENGLSAQLPGDCTLKVVDASASFPDVASDDWYAEQGVADFISARGIMTGVETEAGAEFQGDAPTNRGMFVTMLNRLEMEAKAESGEGFADVPEGSWYADSSAWAVEAGIATGYENADGSFTFDGDGNVTREQVAAFLFRYAQWLGLDTDARAEQEIEGVSDFAKDAVSWAVAEGLIKGDDETGAIRPGDSATRAEAATVVMRMIDLMA